MKPNTTLISIITLLVAAAAYWFFFTGTGNQPPLSVDVDTSASQAQTQFAVPVGELQSISFKTGIFSDARFNALTDITTPIAPESFRRTDPFAPTSVTTVRPIISETPIVGTSSPAVGTTQQ